MHVGKQSIQLIYKSSLRAGKLILSLLLSLITVVVLMTLLVNLWIRGWIIDSSSDYSFKQQLNNNSFSAISYQRGQLQWYFLTPQITLDNLKIKNNQVNLSSSQARLTIDIWGSLKHEALIIRDLLLTDNDLEIRPQQSNKPLELQWLESMLFAAEHWQLKETKLNWVNARQGQHVTADKEAFIELLHIENNGNFHRLIVDSGDSSVIAELTGESQLDKLQGKLYIKIADDSLNLIGSLLDIEGLEFKGSTIESWIDIQKQFTLSGYARIDVNALIGNKHQFKLPFEHVDFQYEKLAFNLSIPSTVNLNDLSTWVTDYLAIAKIKNAEKLAKKINAFNLQGEANELNVNASIGGDNKPVVSVTGRLNQASINAVKKIPGLTNINGAFGLNHNSGFIELASENVAIDLKNNYNDAQIIDNIKGKVYWEVKQHDNQVFFFTDSLDLTYKGHRGNMSMSLLTPIVSSAIKKTAKPYHHLTLKIGLQQLNLNNLNDVLPLQVSNQVKRFIDSAILIDSNQNKPLNNLGLVLHEIKSDDFYSSVQIAADAKHLDVKFLEDWPEAQSLTTKVTINNGRVSADIHAGQFMGVDLTSSKIQVADDEHLTFRLSGHVRGVGNQLLDVLRKTPLRNNIGDQLDSIELNGDVTANINYLRPLASVSEEELTKGQQVMVTATLKNNSLTLQEADLHIEHLQGGVSYQLVKGQNRFSSEKLIAELWQQPLDMMVDSNSDSVIIDIQSIFDTQTLKREFDLNLSEFIKGKTTVSGQVLLPFSEQSPQQFNFTSVGEGIIIDLPLGFGKSATQTSHIDIKISNSSQKQQLDIDYQSPDGASLHSLFDYDVDEQRQASLKGIVASLYQHDSHALTPSFAINRGYLNLDGHLANADQETMITLIQRFTQLSGPDDDDEATVAQHLVVGLQPEINLVIDNIQLGDNFSVANVEANLTSDSQSWVVDFKQDLIDGTLYFYHDERLPLAKFTQIDIQRLLEFSGDGTDEGQNNSQGEDKFVNVQPHLLPSLTIQIDNLKHSSIELGYLFFDMVSTSTGILFENIDSGLFEQNNNLSTDNPNKIEWSLIEGKHRTIMDIDFVSKPLPEIINALLEQDIITSKSLALDAHFEWQGSPVAFFLNRLDGELAFILKDGTFNEIPASTNLLARLISLINLDNWSKRLLLDFSDVTSRGTAFDKIEGSLMLNEGEITIVNAVKAKLPASKIELTGSANLTDDSVDAELSLKLPIIQNTAWLAGFLINLPAAAGLYLISKLFSKEIENLTDVTYKVEGKLSEPNIKLKRVKKNKSS